MERKPCPFCGDPRTDLTQEDLSGHSMHVWIEHYVKCENCEAAGPRAKTPEEAETLWNTRKEAP
jgi:Lar family restriction alleviation protein